MKILITLNIGEMTHNVITNNFFHLLMPLHKTVTKRKTPLKSITTFQEYKVQLLFDHHT
jgi:hypothetical protein